MTIWNTTIDRFLYKQSIIFIILHFLLLNYRNRKILYLANKLAKEGESINTKLLNYPRVDTLVIFLPTI